MKTLLITLFAFINVAAAQSRIVAEYKFENFTNNETFGNIVKVFVHDNGLLEITQPKSNSIFSSGTKPNINDVMLEMPQEKLYTSLPAQLAALSQVKTESFVHESVCKMMVFDTEIQTLKVNINGQMKIISTSGDCWEHVTVRAINIGDAERISRIKMDIENIVTKRLEK